MSGEHVLRVNLSQVPLHELPEDLWRTCPGCGIDPPFIIWLARGCGMGLRAGRDKTGPCLVVFSLVKPPPEPPPHLIRLLDHHWRAVVEHLICLGN